MTRTFATELTSFSNCLTEKLHYIFCSLLKIESILQLNMALSFPVSNNSQYLYIDRY